MTICKLLLTALFCAVTSELLLHSECEEDWHFTGPNRALERTAFCLNHTILNGVVWYFSSICTLATDGHNDTCTDQLRTDYAAVLGIQFDRMLYIKGIRLYQPFANHGGLKNFRILSGNRVLLYDDEKAAIPLYQQAIISIPLTGDRAYPKIIISTPLLDYYPDNRQPTLILCEVQVFAVLCTLPTLLTNASLRYRLISETGSSIDNNYVTPRSVLHFWCEAADYHALSGNTLLTCQNSGVYDASIPMCVERYCSQPPDIAHGHYLSIRPRYSIGEVIQWKCDRNYHFADTFTTLTCTNKGDWNKPYPACNRITCSYPGDMPHGYYVFQNGSKYDSGSVGIGITIVVECDRGFMPPSSNLTIALPKTDDMNTIRCGDSGQWQGENILCVEQVCSRPPNINHGHYIPNKQKYFAGETVNWTCDAYYHSTPAYRSLTCSAEGKWNTPYPSCSLITCSCPGNMTDGYYLFHNGSKYAPGRVGVGTNISIECDPGFIPSSLSLNISSHYTRYDNVLTCGNSGQWHGENFTCVLITVTSQDQRVKFVSAGVGAAVLFLAIVALLLLLAIHRRKCTKKNTTEKNTGEQPAFIPRESGDFGISESLEDFYDEIASLNSHVDIIVMQQLHTDRCSVDTRSEQSSEAMNTGIFPGDCFVASASVVGNDISERETMENSNNDNDGKLVQKHDSQQFAGPITSIEHDYSEIQIDDNKYYLTPVGCQKSTIDQRTTPDAAEQRKRPEPCHEYYITAI